MTAPLTAVDRPNQTSPARIAAGAGAVVVALTAVALAWWRADQTLLPIGTVTSVSVFLLLVFGAVTVAVRVRRGRLEPMLAGLIAVSAAIVLSGLVELPKFPSIEAIGRSFLFFPLTLGALAAAWIAAADRRRATVDAGLAVFVLLTACGGPLFLRVADERYAMLVLYAVLLVLSIPGGIGGFLRVPFARLATALVCLGALASVTTVDLDRHLHGVSRLALVVVPLLVLGTGPADLGRAWFATRAFAWSVIVCVGAAAIAATELVRMFGPRLGLNVRLTLFGEHPNIVAPFFAVAPPLLLALAAGSSRTRGRVGWTLAALLSLAALLLPRSRAAALGAAVGLAAYALLLAAPWLRRRLSDRHLVVGGAALAVAVLLTGFVARGPLAQRLESDTMQYRLTMWSTAADAIAARPWTGYGFLTGDPLMVHAESGDLDGRSKDTHPHSVPLAIALAAGIPAALLFLAWIASFLFRTTRVAVGAGGRGARRLAAGVVASAIALLAANTLDQGLAMHAPVALHLGLLIGLGALLVRVRKEEAAAPVRPDETDPPDDIESTDARPRLSRWRAVLAGAALLAATAFATLSMLAERLMQTAQTEIRRQRGDAAVDTASRAVTLEPFSLDLGLRYVDVLLRDGDPDAARAELARISGRHPMSWQPWEKLSMLEWRESNLDASQAALERARELDPTGPLDATWHLRTSKICARQGRRDEAFEAMARAFRFDYEAMIRVPWDEFDAVPGEEDLSVEIEEMGGSIRLSLLLQRNREAMRTALADDIVAARRIATVLVKGYGFLGRFDDARAVIDEFEARSATTWLPMTYLRLWVERQEAERSGVELTEATAPEVSMIEGVAGEAGLRMYRGQGLLASGDPAGAVLMFERALDSVYGIVAEKEYVLLIFDGLVDAHVALRDFEAADEALERSLYFQASPAARVTKLASFAAALKEAGRVDAALSRLGDAAEEARFLGPTPDARQALRVLGDELAPFAGQRADQVIARAAGTAPAMLLEARCLNQLGRTVESRRLFAEFEGRYPDWARRAP